MPEEALRHWHHVRAVWVRTLNAASGRDLEIARAGIMMCDANIERLERDARSHGLRSTGGDDHVSR